MCVRHVSGEVVPMGIGPASLCCLYMGWGGVRLGVGPTDYSSGKSIVLSLLSRVIYVLCCKGKTNNKQKKNVGIKTKLH
jgi:hypothetical protein